MTSAELSLVQYRRINDQRARLGVQIHGRLYQAPDDWPGDVLSLVRDWSRWAPAVRELNPATLEAEPHEHALLAPLTYPEKVICAGANFYDHAKEMGTAVPDPMAEPFFFLKPPTTTVVGTGEAVVMPNRSGVDLDWEAELGVVIADVCSDVLENEARNHIAGYVIANDISARGLFHREGAVFPAFSWDWVSHKALDTFCPVGPGFVPAWEIQDPQDLAIRLTINGELQQDSRTSDMVVGIDRLVAAASRTMTLEPGDLILTGTPAGVGMPRKRFLSVGDVMVAEIEGLGRLTNQVVAR
jgi:2-keto-4-pentenoate hydratase/2-oxohepta-3-ene-1,7-dioic acid hydratase in catechol pathway